MRRYDLCNEPVTVRSLTLDNTAERLFVRATFSGTPGGYHAELADDTAWPAEVPKFNVTGTFQESTKLWNERPVPVDVPDAKPLGGAMRPEIFTTRAERETLPHV